MVLSKKLEEAINAQIQAELYSAYMYLSMSAYCESINLSGFAHWFRAQTQEEQEHAMKFYKYVHERGGRVVLEAIQQPPVDYESILDLAEKIYAHEQHVTSLIYALYELAVAEKDHATASFLQWYIDEQVEEEDNTRTMVDQLQMVGDSVNGLIMLDRYMASRGG
jgi:ferritin